jgi:alpha-1,3-rhamnosyltransferase
MTSAQPLVSVCIPSFNHGQYLAEAIESALRQTFHSFEIVIVDDGSTDDSLDIAQAYGRRHPGRIRVMTHPGHRNHGIAATANLALRSARGRYWAGLCSDDVWLPDRLQRQIGVLERCPRVGIVYGRATAIDQNGLELSGRILGADITRSGRPLDRLLQANLIPATSILARRDALIASGLHDGELSYQDWHLWLVVLAHWDAAFIPHVLARYRLHPSNTVGVSSSVDEQALDARAVMLKLQSQAPHIGGRLEDARTRALIELQIAFYSFVLGEYEPAATALRLAFAHDSTLLGDKSFVLDWLARRAVSALHPTADGCFAAWFVDHAPVPRGRRWLQRDVVALRYLANASRNIRAGARWRGGLNVVNALRVEPRLLRVAHGARDERRLASALRPLG